MTVTRHDVLVVDSPFSFSLAFVFCSSFFLHEILLILMNARDETSEENFILAESALGLNFDGVEIYHDQI